MASIESRSATSLPGLGEFNAASGENSNASPANISMSITSCAHSADLEDVVVKIAPALEGTRTATDVCCVVDVSGSMGTEVQNGDTESQGLSILDIVKHALKSIIHSLTPQDRFSLVAYSSKATLKLDLTIMDDAGKSTAVAEVENLAAGGQTNLWDGLHTGLEVLNKGADGAHMAAVLLLTDGQPNVNPPRGHIHHLQQYKDETDLICSISTFGFGYNLDSVLLQDLAIEGQGQYAFIPDGSFVGTCFVNATSNILSTAARQCVLKLSNVDTENADCLGYSKTVTKASWGLQIPLGNITYGQSKDVVVRVPAGSAAGLRADLDYMLVTPDRLSTFAEGLGVANDGAGGEVAAVGGLSVDPFVQSLRAQFVTVVREASELFKSHQQVEAQAKIASFTAHAKAVNEAGASHDQRVTDLVADLEGQVTEALSRPDWFNKWGRHFLPSLVNAHHLQQCNNFKDPGVQHYGGTLFHALRDTAEQAFLKLPPPTPTARSYPGRSYSHGSSGSTAAVARVVATPVDMSAYYNAGGGCFAGACRVLMADGVSSKRADALRAGDRVATSTDATSAPATVKYVIKTEVAKGESTLLVQIPRGTGRLMVTAWHPIWLSEYGGWVFPAHMAAVADAASEATQKLAALHSSNDVPSVFNLVLENDDGSFATHAIVEGVPTISLAHGICNDPVASHNYYGTRAAVDDLEAAFGVGEKSHGVIRIPAGAKALQRDPSTGCVTRTVVAASYSASSPIVGNAHALTA